MLRFPSRGLWAAAAVVITSTWSLPSWAQITQSDWSGGPNTANSTNLTGETGYASGADHMFTSGGSARVVQFLYTDENGTYPALPLRVDQDPVDYYDRQGSGGTPVYPPAECLKSRYWLYRNLSGGKVSWFFHVNVNGLDSDPCSGEIDATYSVTPNGVLLTSDEDGESTLTGFDHFWINEWADGHVVEFTGGTWNVDGTIDRVIAVTDHDMHLDDQGTTANFALSDSMMPKPFTIDSNLGGRLESAVFDSGMAQTWGMVTLTSTEVGTNTVQIFVRGGATEAATTSAAWEGPYASGDDVGSGSMANAQFVQYAIQVTLEDIEGQSPVPEEPSVTITQISIAGAGDSDGDGIPDGTEIAIGTDPMDADSDDDGINDGDETDYDQDTDGDGLINALDPDSDDDGLLDGTEVGNDCSGADTDVSVGNCTPDGDGGATTTDPLDADTDDGGVNDGAEDTNLNGVVDEGETDPTAGNGDDDMSNTDSDGDGLSDDLEISIGTDPNDADSDDDGLPDGEEPNPGLDSDGDGQINALDPDSDNDGLYDGTETGKDCNGPGTDASAGHCVPDGDGGTTTTSPIDPDTDDGGVTDGSEDANGNGVVDDGETDPTAGNGADDADPANNDSDGDGLTDNFETNIGTDPNDADSDDDGVPDGQEPNPADDQDGDGLINALDPDSDDDGLFDGTELGRDCDGEGTDASAGNCIPDADGGSTTTSPLDPDTDDGGIPDGVEDANKNGQIDPGEGDPNNPVDDVPGGIGNPNIGYTILGGGCGCHVPGEDSGGGRLALLFGAALAVLFRRRRRTLNQSR